MFGVGFIGRIDDEAMLLPLFCATMTRPTSRKKKKVPFAGIDIAVTTPGPHGVASSCACLQYPNRLAVEKRQGVLDALPEILAVYLDHRVAQMRGEHRVRRAS